MTAFFSPLRVDANQGQKTLPGLNDTLVEWKDGTYDTTARILCVIASAIIPSVAIIVLYFIHSMLARILVSVAFSSVFAVAVALLTAARSAEVFAATAA
jgi:hypothetical protein